VSTIASALLVMGVFAYMFYPDGAVETQVVKTWLEFLGERREVLYDNLRDLNFEYRAGKYPEEDYVAQRAVLENEAATIVAEINDLEGAESQ
jgi:hypothetical protein